MKKRIGLALATLLAIGGMYVLLRKTTGEEPARMEDRSRSDRPSSGWSWESETPAAPGEAAKKLLSPAEVRAALGDLKGLLADLERVKELYERKDRKRYREESEAIKEKIRKIRLALRGTIQDSKEAQEEILKEVETASGARSKRDLARLLGDLDVDTQSTYFNRLAETGNPENQQVAVQMLSMLKTDAALEGMKKLADSSATDPKVRGDALRGMGRSIAYHDDPAFRDKARQTIYGFGDPKYDAGIRKGAYESLVMNPYITQADKEFLAKAAANEKDPQALRAAQFSLKVAEASLRSKEKRGATVR